uniref:Uncharacterized protein n=1 Tax=Avena sativa TaxID=4498 RepID=A0ACD5U0A0_AVESA
MGRESCSGWTPGFWGGLSQEFPALFAICAVPTMLVADAFREDQWNISFWRTFNGAEAADFVRMRGSLPLSLSAERDKVAWVQSPSGAFAVGSAYRSLFQGPELPWTSHLWKSPLPLSICIFLWQFLRDRLPSGTEVSKRCGPGNGLCPLCGVPESCTHIMFTCPAARFLWNFIREALGPAWQA